MDIEVITKDGEEFLNLTNIAKEHYKRYLKVLNVSQYVKNIPESYIITGKGRNSRTYIKISIVEMFFSTKRNLNKEFVEDVFKALEIYNFDKFNPRSYETFFLDILRSFLRGMFNDINVGKQYSIGGRTFDALINNKILIEFDERHHKNNKENDILKDRIADANNLILIRINSNCDYGLEISRVYKKIKEIIY